MYMISLTVASFLFPGLLSLWGQYPGSQTSGPRFLIHPMSKLEIHGTSNVNAFTCTCRQTFVSLPFQIVGGYHPERTQWAFRNTHLRLQTQLFDCGNKVMNKDFYHALKAKTHPTMWIELESIENVQPIKSAWTTLATHTRITIAGTSRSVPVQTRVRKLSEGKLQIYAERALKMSDFGIQPPTALMGMIKTNDEIIIKLDLVVEILSL